MATSDPVDPNGEITTQLGTEPDTIDPQKESFTTEIAQTLMADVEPDRAKRLELYRQAQRVLTRDAPVAFLYTSETRYLVSPRLRGYVLTASDWEFGQFTTATMYVAKPGF